MVFRGAAQRNLREVGRLLGAVHILEGGVRRASDRVVVSVQLIDARDDHHVWAHRYDEKLADALGLQGELAQEIAETLRATIYHFHEPRTAWKEMARREAETALRLQPELAEAHFALGLCIYWIDADYDRALAEFNFASDWRRAMRRPAF